MKEFKEFIKVVVLVLVAGFILLQLSSCKTVKQAMSPKVAKEAETTNNDSFVYKEKLVHDTITVPGESIIIKIPVPVNCDSSKTQQLKNSVTNKETHYQSKSSHSSLTVDQTANQFTINCTCDSFKAIVNAKNTEIQQLKATSHSTSQTITVPVAFVPWYDIACRWLAGIFILLIIIIIIIHRI